MHNCWSVQIHWCLTVCVSIGMKEPDKPGRPVVNSVKGRQVTIGWTPPDGHSRSQFIQYIIYYSSVDMDLESFVKPRIAGRSRSCTFSKLLKFNRMCKFAVAAENKSGIGPLSEFSECVKTPTHRGKNIKWWVFFSVEFDFFLNDYSDLTLSQFCKQCFHFVSHKKLQSCYYYSWQLEFGRWHFILEVPLNHHHYHHHKLSHHPLEFDSYLLLSCVLAPVLTFSTLLKSFSAFHTLLHVFPFSTYGHHVVSFCPFWYQFLNVIAFKHCLLNLL